MYNQWRMLDQRQWEQIKTIIKIVQGIFLTLWLLMSDNNLTLKTRRKLIKVLHHCTAWKGGLKKSQTCAVTTRLNLTIYDNEQKDFIQFRRLLNSSWVSRIPNAVNLIWLNRWQDLLTAINSRKSAYFEYIYRRSRYSLVQFSFNQNAQYQFSDTF